MEVRKYPAADLESHKLLFYSIGLVVSLVLVIIAFEWKSYDKGELANLGGDVDAMFDELVEIPPTEQPPPPPPSQTKLANLVEVDELEEIDEIEVNIDIEMTEDMVVEEVAVVDDMDLGDDEEVAEEIFTVVEQNPSPEGGMAAFYEFVYSEIKYPRSALKAGIQGRVYLQFVVGKDGDVRDVMVVKGIGAGCDEEAVRVFNLAPNWKPGKQRGKPVAVRMVVPIQFKIM